MTQETQPSNQETVILSLLWDQGPMTARAVLEAMPDGKKRAYTSVLSVLQAMERKGLVNHVTEAKTNIYRAVATRDKVLGRMMRTMVQNVFAGNPTAVMQSLLKETEVGEDDLKEMRRLLRSHRSEEGKLKGDSE